MRIYIVEDDENIIRILERIIIDKSLGDVIGKSGNGNSGINEIERLKPDIVLVDLLMPGKDGISLVREAKMIYPDVQYIMISQVSSKDMISKAYQSGVEYYISKPIDAIEVQTVINKVKEKINMNKKLSQIQSLFSGEEKDTKKVSNKSQDIEGVKRVMQRIGLIGELGSQDILDVTKYLIDTSKSMSDFTVKELCSKFTDNPKTMEQRIRRTATVGMINLANIGIEDYMNEIFTEYSNGLYNFEQLKIEMDFIRGKTKKRGKVNIKKFIDGMVYYGKLQ
ncbi:response regulator [Tissierella pigra]|uniref:Response regulator n=1 Tax=Tissierella pigra TaxID=2607614 RepID=A0A6N7XSZ7_9FIRM|nr:response regulator [Tissierella pigra]MBU5425559.1 response regulator [Tissierella pigra]MSU00887.1 response regulator [Tissierella pigra]